MDKTEAIDLLRQCSAWLSERWSMSPEGREYKARFDTAVDVLAGIPAGVKYGCHCDLDPDMEPDGCVIEEGRTDDCVMARKLVAEGKGRNDCDEWRPVAFEKPNALGNRLPATGAAKHGEEG